MDPITISAAVTGATAAFNSIKQMIAAGRAKNPPIFKKLFAAGSIEEEALASYAAKKKLEAQRQELKTFLNMQYGPQAWADLIKLEGKIRKQRQQAIYAQQELRRQILEGIAITILVLLCLAVLGAIIWAFRH